MADLPEKNKSESLPALDKLKMDVVNVVLWFHSGVAILALILLNTQNSAQLPLYSVLVAIRLICTII